MIFKSPNKKLKGFTLIELMIAILIGALVIGATLTIYVTTIRGSSNTLKLTRLNQDLGVTLLIMTNDIRRAGYWGGAIVGANLTLNPFSDVAVRDIGDVAIGDPTVAPVTGNCITYSYDADAYDDPAYDPDVDSVAPDADEYFGFRVNNGAVQIKTSGTTSIDAQCGDGVWVNLTDPEEINVTELAFTLVADNSATNASGNTVTARQVSIRIEAQMVSDADINTQLDDENAVNDVVKIRNNLIEP
ncbi:MAG: prepilin-type N-terminal cleavage/methylation domain-containing protein [Methylophaga sp.]